ncbi:MAG: ABC transporter ATP-binding protein [Firmicutes bacterium]|nr:ABC transporter ATP-binding protein [Bacillota bacterium]
MRFRLEEDEKLVADSFNKSHFLRLLGYLSPHRGQAVTIIGLMVVISGAGLAGPYLMGLAVDRYILNRDMRGLDIVVLIYLFTALVSWMCSARRMYLLTQLGQRVLCRMRGQLFGHVTGMSMEFFETRPAGKIITRLTNDINALNELLTNGLLNMLVEFVSLLGIVILLVLIHSRLALVSFITLPMLLYLGFRVRPRIRQAYRVIRRKIATINAAIHESIAGIRVTHAFVRQKENIRWFDDLNLDNLRANLKAAAMHMMFGPSVEFAGAIGTCAVIWYGAFQLFQGQLSVGMLVAFLGYLHRFWGPVSTLSAFYNQVQGAMASAERVFEILDTPQTVAEAPNAVSTATLAGGVEFRSVGFGYEAGRPVLKDFNLLVEPGETVALVGPTGAGKTTIISLVSRFYDVSEGCVLLDGIDVRRLKLATLRRHVVMVAQDVFIFSGTIRENLRYGRLDATEDEIMRAAEAANLDHFVRTLPAGYDTVLHERGANLSTGQRQLMAFARAVLADPRILVLDEATSNIDSETERLVQDALGKILAGRTSFVVAHRLATVKSATRIIVIDHGRVVEAGTHEELLQHPSGLYRILYTAQFRAS